MRITVIVPVYNAKPYLRRCLDSIVTQTYTDFEAIVVDDGSTDNSGAICDEYAARDSRVVTLHKENNGLSTARNLGLDTARGNYVMFVDADDWIEPDTLKYAMEMIGRESIDVLCLGMRTDEGICQVKYHEELVGRDVIRNWICNIVNSTAEASKHDIPVVSAWAKLYLRKNIEDYHLRFDNDLKVGEDFWFNLLYYDCCERIVLDNKTIYHYVMNTESLIHKFSDTRLQAGIEFMSRLEGYYHRQMNDCMEFRQGVCYQLLTTLQVASSSYFVHPANKDSIMQRCRELNSYLAEPVIKRWTAELSLKEWRNARDLRDIIFLKTHLYWIRLLSIPVKRKLKQLVKEFI